MFENLLSFLKKPEMVEISGPCVLKFKRIKSYRGHIRKFDIYLDDKFIAQIEIDQTIEKNCEEGVHSLYIKLDGMTSQILTFSTKAGEVRTFDITCTMESGLLLFDTTN